jgi:hypothetical protein
MVNRKERRKKIKNRRRKLKRKVKVREGYCGNKK